MDQQYEIPVFLINGFLDSGKTTFITETIKQGQFDDAQKKLLIVLEEGEEEYDKEVLKKHGMDIVSLEKEEFNTAMLQKLDKEYDPWLIVIEYNGMWESDPIFNMKMPFGWTIYQSITIVNAETFEVSWNNMKSFAIETIKNAEMVIFNRCASGMNLGSYRRSVKVNAPSAQIIFENTDGSMASIAEQLPYDLNADVIEVEDDDYGIFYMDLNERPEMYQGKTVRYKGMVYRGKRMKDGMFIPGRKAMTCCADDTSFMGYVCKWDKADTLTDRQWVMIEAVMKYEFSMAYKKKGPVMYATKVEQAEAPREELVYF